MDGPISVGIIGFGRSGKGIHADVIAQLPGMYRVTAVCDPLEERVAEAKAELGCAGYASAEALLAHEGLELVVVASPNCFHARQAIAALESGRHVLCEKPFGFTTADVDAMIAAAEKSGTVLQPFQQRRYEPDFRKIKEVCESGLLGRLTFIRVAWHGFSRRWDWQTSRAFGGGQLYNNGPHPIDHAMELMGVPDPRVTCEVRNSLSSGDAEDEAHIGLHAPDAPLTTVEILATDPFPHDRWQICGTAGGLRGTSRKVQWMWVDWSEMPERPLDTRPTEGRSYNREKLPWNEEAWEAASAGDAGAGAAPAWQPAADLYTDLWRTIREGKPQVITPQSVRRRVAVLEQCYKLNDIAFPEGTRTG